jgi:hypothetical protein
MKYWQLFSCLWTQANFSSLHEKYYTLHIPSSQIWHLKCFKIWRILNACMMPQVEKSTQETLFPTQIIKECFIKLTSSCVCIYET